MAASILLPDDDTVIRFPRSTDNGLWSALASRVSERADGVGTGVPGSARSARSAAGSGLAGPTRPSQPISRLRPAVVVDMFAFRDRLVPDPVPAA